jgi:glycosyltransferase involved in cell wall biosynthesis
VIGTLGRLVPYKGHHHLVRAAALLSDDFPGLRVVLAGVPEPQYPGYRESLVDLGRELGLGDRLELPGFVPPADVLERLSVFVNATFRDEEGFGFEGLSGAMLEASWAGIPVVATLGGGTAEGVADGQTGTLVAQADPQLLADAIRPYLIDPELAARTGDAGARFARERFAPPVVAARLFELLAVAAR